MDNKEHCKNNIQWKEGKFGVRTSHMMPSYPEWAQRLLALATDVKHGLTSCKSKQLLYEGGHALLARVSLASTRPKQGPGGSDD